MSDPKLSIEVARQAARWHQLDFPGSKTPILFFTLRRWLDCIPDTFHDPGKNAVFKEHFTKEMLSHELDIAQETPLRFNSKIMFCHNDLLSANIIENGGEVSFIDYEYAAYNYAAYDIANHFCEFAGFDCDYDLFPDKDFQCRWIAAYLGDASLEALEKWQEEVESYVPISHMYWTIWGLLQAANSDIDFDYLSYAVKRFKQYIKSKETNCSL